MPATKQTQTITVANQIIGMGAQLLDIYNAYTSLRHTYDDVGMTDILHAQQTAPLGADGTLGTPDADPVTTNPMTDPNLRKSLSSFEVISLLDFLSNFQTLVQTGGNRVLLSNAKN